MIWSQFINNFYSQNPSKRPNHTGKALRGHTQTTWTNEGEWGCWKSYNTQIDLLSISVLIGGRGAEKAPYSDHVDCVMCMWYYNDIFVVVT